mgnify:CR=1 FL=1
MDTRPLANALDLQTLRDKTPKGEGIKEYIDELNSRVATFQEDSTATDVTGLVADFNALLQKLRDAGLMASE